MTRTPPGLLYLAIYNPTLLPAVGSLPDDEDAEEQAHILFYTARERAVSRDRMLRQVGLAKALISFSDTFNHEQTCENVHAQSRRMIMVSPEPDFWIHACLELAKTPRPAASPRKKGGDKTKDKRAEKLEQQDILYNYHDSSLHDSLLRAQLMQGYEEFKLIHGSFSFILSTSGQEALEAQLERFFTVWAWKWDLDAQVDFASYLGTPLHPGYSSLREILDEFASTLQESTCVFALAPPYVIPSTRFIDSKFPTALLRHGISRVTLRAKIKRSRTEDSTSTDTVRQDDATSDVAPHGVSFEKVSDAPGTQHATITTTAIMPSFSIGVDMLNLKWGWPGKWTFGKGASPQPSSVPPTAPPTSAPSTSAPSGPSDIDQEHAGRDVEQDTSIGNSAVDVDAESLQEAISTDYVHSPTTLQTPPLGAGSSAASQTPVTPTDDITCQSTKLALAANGPETRETNDVSAHTSDMKSVASMNQDDSATNVAASDSDPGPTRPAPTASTFIWTTVHLARLPDSIETEKRRIWYLTSDDHLTLALITDDDSTVEVDKLVMSASEVLSAMRQVMDEQEYKANAEVPIPSATKILQPHDVHIICKDGLTAVSGFTSMDGAEHLLNAHETFKSDLDVSEIFSRAQNPPNWHVAKRDSGLSDGGPLEGGQAYMQTAKRESTLADVDNEVAAVMRQLADSLHKL